MTIQRPVGGSLPVGHLDTLSPIEAASVVALRLWHEDLDRQRRTHDAGDPDPVFAAPAAAVRALDELCELMARFCRRPLQRHSAGCPCVGADEACFASLVAAASEGRHEDALMIAVLIVRPDIAPLVVGLAGTAGHRLRAMACGHGAADAPPHRIH